MAGMCLCKGLFLQMNGREFDLSDLEAKARKNWESYGNGVNKLESLVYYIKPEDNRVYYVANDEVTGSVDL